MAILDPASDTAIAAADSEQRVMMITTNVEECRLLQRLGRYPPRTVPFKSHVASVGCAGIVPRPRQSKVKVKGKSKQSLLTFTFTQEAALESKSKSKSKNLLPR